MNKLMAVIILLSIISCHTGPSFDERLAHASHCLHKPLDSLQKLIDSNELIVDEKKGLEWIEQENISQRWRMDRQILLLQELDSIQNVKK